MYSLRYYQREACDAAWRDLCEQAGNPVIELPTGAGKSLVIAEICREAVQKYNGRVMILAHRAELLQQNAEKVKSLLPGVSVGLYSAGLRRFATDTDVVLGGIQSVYKKAELFGARHLVLIDEVHLCPFDGEGRYQAFISELRRFNPHLRMVGLTATPYRTGEGSICRPDGLFQRICYSAKIPELIAGGFLSPLTNQVGATSFDTSTLHVRGGEFIAGEMERLFDQHEKVVSAAKEILIRTEGRRSVLIFCAGVAHAQHVKDVLSGLSSQEVGVITGGTLPLERSSLLSRFKSGTLRFLCNVDVLTTGFDAPNIDAIAILRATESPGLFVQICGRGFRTSPGKEDCLILDFGENLQRHGPLDAIDFGKKRKGTGGGDAPKKACPNCDEPCPVSVLICESCGWKFPPRELKHDTQADTDTAILSKPQRFIVEEVRLNRHKKRNAKEGDPDTLRVDYLCTACEGDILETISEWVCLEHTGWAGDKAGKWWKQRSNAVLDEPYIDSAIDLWQRGAMATPTYLTAIREGRFWKITEQTLDPKPTSWSDEAAEELFEDSPF